MGRRRLNAGFTLTELVIIVVLVAILVVTVGMKFGSMATGTNLRIAVDQVAADLRFLQSRTMATMSRTDAGYTNTVRFPAGGTTYDLGGQVKRLPAGVTLSIGATQTVTFNSLGEYNATTDAVLTLAAGNVTGSVRIYSISGGVEAY